MKQRFLKTIFHPYFVCIYIILNAINVIVVFDFKEFIGIMMFFLISIFSLINLNLRYIQINRYKFSYLLTILIYSFFFIYEISIFFREVTFIHFRLRYTIIILTLLFLFFSILLFKTKRELLKINLYLNLLFFFFCGFEIYNFIEQKRSQSEVISVNKKVNKSKPNIYFLMIDGYANNKSLAKYWGYDNRPFTDSLQKLGFKYIENSKSDYLFTVQTVASMLNLRSIADTEKGDFARLLKNIRFNSLFESFRGLGYNVENLSIFSIDKVMDIYPFWFGNYQGSIKAILFHNSIFGRYLDKENFDNSFNQKIKRELFINKKLVEIAKDNMIKPKFVFFHSLQVHHPFEQNGANNLDELLNNVESNRNSFQTLKSHNRDMIWKKTYLYQLQICNKNTIHNISKIVKFDPNSIIFLFSDHGFRLLTGVPTSEARKEAFMNLSAVYMPNHANTDIQKLSTPTEFAIYIHRLVSQ